MMPNCTGSESMHGSMKASAMKKKLGLVEACQVDQNRAVGQIAAYTAYLEGRHRGKGPTIFELAFRSADSIGSTKAFEDATNLVLSNSPKYDLEQKGGLNGDLQTKSKKRKGFAEGKISQNDSHRHDTVLLTSPVTRGCRRRNLNAADFCTFSSAKGDAKTQETIIISEEDGSSEDVEIVQTPSRPITRSSHSSQRCPPGVSKLTENGVVETIVATRTWHLRRCSKKGKSLQCYGSCDSGSNRLDCRILLRKAGFPNKDGVVGVAIDGFRTFQGVPVSGVVWFCPNNKCHLSRPRRALGKLPAPPLVLHVLIGMNLSAGEQEYLRELGFKWVGKPDGSSSNPEVTDLRIDVDLFFEKINFDDTTFRALSRNGRNARQQVGQTSSHFTRIKSAEDQDMCVVRVRDVAEGNGWGKQILVQNHEEWSGTSRRYWVQVCIFPCCSCEDFWRRHSHSKPFLPCKHIFWVYKNIFQLDLHNSTLVNQPILTVGEVRYILERQNDFHM